jgi:hypothetical protein
MPEALILGDISYSSVEYYNKGDLKFIKVPNEIVLKPEHILARKKLNKFFQEEIDSSPIIHFETDKMKGVVDGMDPEDFSDNTIYESNSQLKRKIAKP